MRLFRTIARVATVALISLSFDARVAIAQEKFNQADLREIDAGNGIILKGALGMLLSCHGMEAIGALQKVKSACFEGVSQIVEQIARDEGWEVDELKTQLNNSTPDKIEIEQDAASVVAEKAAEEQPLSKGKWTVLTDRSAIDDSTNVYLSINSNDHIRKRYGSAGPMQLFIHCRENTTMLFATFNGHFMSDLNNGTVTYRLDENKARKKRMRASNDHSALGLWNGGASIPFIKELLGHKKMLLVATPHSESSVQATFDVAGLAEAIKPLRASCNW